MDLFRNEALQARQQHSLGNVDLTSSPMAWPMAALAAGFIAVIVLFGLLGQYERSERVTGQLVPAGGLLTVMAQDTGVVARILIEEGEAVSKGQPLAEISVERESPGLDGRGLGEAVRTALERQQSQLLSDLMDLNSSQMFGAQKLAQQIELLRSKLALVDAQHAIKLRQLVSAQGLLERIESLDPGVLTALQIQQYEAAALAAEAELNQIVMQQLEVRSELDEALEQQGSTPLQIAERRSTIERALAEITQSMARNETERTLVLKAPRAGVISGLSVSPGQAVAQGRRLLSLIPEGAQLRAELWVPTEAVGLLDPGTRVAMRYHAFPYQQFGHQYGRIAAIARSVLTPDDILEVTGVAVEVPSFRVLVELDRQELSFAQRTLALRAGMSLDADLLLESRPLYRLVLGPSDSLAAAPVQGSVGSTTGDPQ